nr:hypothetical protein [uncultured Draconibacterium sp.]
MKIKLNYLVICFFIVFASCEDSTIDTTGADVHEEDLNDYVEKSIRMSIAEGNPVDLTMLDYYSASSSIYDHQIRFGLGATSGLCVSAQLSCPFVAGSLAFGCGSPSGVVTDPLFVTSNLETYVEFTVLHPCYCVPGGPHTLIVTNSLGYRKEIQMYSNYTFKGLIPLDPNANTVITIFLKK